MFNNEAIMVTDSIPITTQTESVACLSLNHIQIDDVDTLICSFGNGKILKLYYHINSIINKSVLEQAEDSVSCANADELGSTR